MVEHIKADGPACVTCAAKTLTAEGTICQPWRLGQKNRNYGKTKRRFGVSTGSGTAKRPLLCPHPESQISTTPNTQVLLRKILKK